MVSGFVTSPWDQLRIFSGDARLIRMASKSAIGLARSKGLERNKVILCFLLSESVASSEYLVPSYGSTSARERCALRNVLFKLSGAVTVLNLPPLRPASSLRP